MKEFKNLHDVATFFDTEAKCHEYLAQLRWNGKPVCVHCGSVKVYKLSYKFRYKCGEKECKKDFTAKVGTIFEQCHVPLRKCFFALYIISSHKKGISSLQLSRDIGVTQKTAWFLLHRFREMLKDSNPELLGGIVEIDEYYHGGSIANKHASERQKIRASGIDNKTPMLAILERNGRVVTRVLTAATKEMVLPLIREKVEFATKIYTDSSKLYHDLKDNYYHASVDHSSGIYAINDIHSNGVENFFSLLSRGIIGIYHSVSAKHLQRYCDEYSWRFERRECGEVHRFNLSLENSEGRLTYKDLIASPDIPKPKRDWKDLRKKHEEIALSKGNGNPSPEVPKM